MEKKHVIIIITGRVQGVFFRASAADMARSLGVCGLVRNRHDGSVYIEAEAAPRELEEFVSWCRKGPPAARVDTCNVSEGVPKEYPNFEIQH